MGLVAVNNDIYQGVCKVDLLIHGMEFKQRLISDVVTGQICVAKPQKGEQQ